MAPLAPLAPEETRAPLGKWAEMEYQVALDQL